MSVTLALRRCNLETLHFGETGLIVLLQLRGLNWIFFMGFLLMMFIVVDDDDHDDGSGGGGDDVDDCCDNDDDDDVSGDDCGMTVVLSETSG